MKAGPSRRSTATAIVSEPIRRFFDKGGLSLRIPAVEADDLPTRLREVPLSFHAVDQVDVSALARGLQTDDVVVRGAAFE